MSEWRLAKNRQAVARLTKALPAIFPAPVLTHALRRAFIPGMPRRAVDSYWRMHALRADHLARALAARSGTPNGWTWRLGGGRDDLPASFRIPPTPYREVSFSPGPGFCCMCGQPVYRLGWHVDLWDQGPNKKASWHAACVVAWELWNSPSNYVRMLRRLQRSRCAETGKRLWKTAEIDHRIPLFRVWREQRSLPWPSLLGFWGLPNLQVINRDVHVLKCAGEADFRNATGRIKAFEESGSVI